MGLLSFIQSMGKKDKERKVLVIGPKGSGRFIRQKYDHKVLDGQS